MKSFMFIFFVLFVMRAGAQLRPLTNAHAHNDYVHARPLFDALEHGFTSIEVDVFLHHGNLKVAHLPLSLNKKQNIQQLYLEPLKDWIVKNKGMIYQDYYEPIILMVDFKTNPILTYRKLKQVLKPYRDIFCLYTKDSLVRKGAISILISGRVPYSILLEQDSSLVTIDSRLPEMDNLRKQSVSTRFSSAWGTYFTWNGMGEMPHAEREVLDSLVKKAHSLNKQIRFYGAPDNSAGWRVLLQSGVDFINTDKLEEFRKFSEEYFR